MRISQNTTTEIHWNNGEFVLYTHCSEVVKLASFTTLDKALRYGRKQGIFFTDLKECPLCKGKIVIGDYYKK